MTTVRSRALAVACLAVCVASHLLAQGEHRAMTLSEALSPYTGPVVKGVDNSSIYNKVMCGYQGWFLAKGDGYEPGFVHWGGVDRTPPRASVDLWPDLSEYDEDETFPTNFRYPDGTRARVFSSAVLKTVNRHFEWMAEYGIDGVFVQRFGSCISNQENWNYLRTCAVLNRCREAANRNGRLYAVMYDVNFDQGAVDVIKADWLRLVNEMKLMQTPAYMRHRGAPVVSLWGYGFGHRKFDPKAAEDLLSFFKKPENGGCTIMLGVPNDWASWTDERMTLLRKYGTIISPWNVGRYHSPETAENHFRKYWPGDLAFCTKNDLDYYAVAFPGFSWTNLQKGNSPLNQTPRRGGRFFWSQLEAIKRYGMNMVYVAMFDEVDEGTAIFKCTNHPPVGRFATYEGMPSDLYLRLAGLGGRLLRGEDVSFPKIEPNPADQTYRAMSQLEFYKAKSPFPAATVARWQGWFKGMDIPIHGEPYSEWIRDLYNGDALPIQPTDWAEIVKRKAALPLLVVATGNEGFNEGGTPVDDIVAYAKRHLRRGGTLLVASGGAYPMYYPEGGKRAAEFGFRLEMTNVPQGSTVTFAKGFGDLPAWQVPRQQGSRLMDASLYPQAKSYTALASVTRPDGTAGGDVIACVQPGGALGDGHIVYVASAMLSHPDRAQVLDAILRYVRSTLPTR
jgi:hypothetical protein